MYGLSFGIFAGEHHFDGLFGDIRIKLHFPLVSPFGDFLKITHRAFLRCIYIVVDSCEQRGIVSEELNVRANTYSQVIYIDKEEKRT